ncbi:bifunctional 2-polyprenyl-6-hydroxyphenol methylase/3-demethylubiquinol 3-O-methyltransferase UbiG [Pseudomonas sp. Q12-87]|uniref:class I SAM-dependent methyltransferase n=1 Tax=Pseudomonas sp. Q12-87 TaxID=177989 RepID=UPI00069EAF75|nr:methyltransferase domain-containing protein [Pseudomonas sp. Q12-87]
MDLKETDILGPDIDRHWYYRSKARAMLHMLKGTSARTLLDVGAGSGFFSHHLLTHTDTAQAWCVDISYPADSDASTAGKPVRYRRAIDALDADLVLLMDVLEHVDDDVGLLKMYVDKVPSGSRFLITVPAFQFLWSGHDDFLEHKRRYTLGQLERVVAQAGLQVQQGAYYFGLVFPIAAALRLLPRARSEVPAKSQLSRHSPLVNGVLKSLCSLERPFMGANRIAGLTVFCLAQKP